MTPAQLLSLTKERHETRVTAKGSVLLVNELGSVDMEFASAEHPLRTGTRVYVWWKGGGFVCAPANEVDSEAEESLRVSRRVAEARLALADARRERASRFGDLNSGSMPLDLNLEEPEGLSIY